MSDVDRTDDSAAQVDISEPPAQQYGQSDVDDLPLVEPTQDALLHPKPLFATSNPSLRPAFDVAPPTPRYSSPSQLVIDSIRPSKVHEDGSLVSPTGRKEGEVQSPTKVCEFPLMSTDDGGEETGTKGTFTSDYSSC
jgi:hypothetical protein